VPEPDIEYRASSSSAGETVSRPTPSAYDVQLSWKTPWPIGMAIPPDGIDGRSRMTKKELARAIDRKE
jgi:hypothetical protein